MTNRFQANQKHVPASVLRINVVGLFRHLRNNLDPIQLSQKKVIFYNNGPTEENVEKERKKVAEKAVGQNVEMYRVTSS